MERIEEFYLELYDSDQAVTIHTDLDSTTSNGMGNGSRAEENEKWERSRKKSQVNIETLKAGHAFVDYEKAFDSVHTQPILISLQEQGIEDVYIQILKDILYTDSSVTVHLHKESEKIRIKGGVRQGAPSHPSCSRQHWRAYLEG